MLPLRSELAMTFTVDFPRLSAGCGRRRPGPNVGPHHTHPAFLRQRFSRAGGREDGPAEGRPGGRAGMEGPGDHGGGRPFLLGRMRIAAALRRFFAERDFVEVETTALVPSPGNETHLHAFATEIVAPAGARERLYLRTSPE